MAVKTLTNQEVIDLLPSVDVMATLEKMFGALGRGEALQPTQVQTVFPAGRGDFINYSGVWMSAGVYGIKTSPYIVKENGYIVTLRVVGRDDIAIVTNITSVIGKEAGISLRSLNINSVDGLFQGNFTVLVKDTASLNQLIKKINTVKGVKQVERLNT